MAKLHIRKGDIVKVLCGSKQDRGKTGRVLIVYPKKQTAIVEGIKMVKKHMKPSQQNPNGGIIEQEAPVHISNLMLMEGSEPTRTGRVKSDTKGWTRVSKKSGKPV